MSDLKHTTPPRNSTDEHKGASYRRIPPHGDVSPDGSRIWPRPSRSSRVIIWGGTAIVAAAATAGAVLAIRHVADMISGQPAPDPQPSNPRSSLAAKPARAASEHRPQPKPQPAADSPRLKPKKPRRPLLEEIEDTNRRLTHSVDGVVATLGGAFASFCKVASQAETVMRTFQSSADLVRTAMAHREKAAPEQAQHKDRHQD